MYIALLNYKQDVRIELLQGIVLSTQPAAPPPLQPWTILLAAWYHNAYYQIRLVAPPFNLCLYCTFSWRPICS